MIEINKFKAGLKIGVTENIEKHGNSFIHKSLCEEMPYEYIDYNSGPTTFYVDFVTSHYAHITSASNRLRFMLPLEVLSDVSFEIEEIKLKNTQWGITNEDLKTIPNDVEIELIEAIKNAQDVAVARHALVCLLYMLRNGHKAAILQDPFNDDTLNTLYTALYEEIEEGLNKNKLKP